MPSKKIGFMIISGGLLLIMLFLYFWWVYSFTSFPLESRTGNADYETRLEKELPKPVTEASGVVLDSKFYLLGGFGPLAQSYSSFFCYDNSKGVWSKLQDYPYKINHAGLTAGNGKLYVAGGFKPIGLRPHGFMFANWKPRDTFMFFDPEKNEWERGPDMPSPRGAGGVCYYDSAIYYVGGINESKKIGNSFFKFDLRTKNWEIMPDMPTSRDHLRMEAVNGVLYAISGREDDMRYNLACVEAFDLNKMTWSKKADIPTARGGYGSTVYNGKIYTFGGESIWSNFDCVEEYNPETDSWKILHSLPKPRHGICAGVIDNEIHLISGGLKPRISISSIHRVLKIRQ